MWQDDRSHYMFNLETKEALKNGWCDDSLFNAQIKRKLLDACSWFLWQIQELPSEELCLLTLRLIALVLFKLFLVEQMQDWTKLKIHWNSDYIFYVSINKSSFDFEKLQANILDVWRYGTGLCINTGTLYLIFLTTDVCRLYAEWTFVNVDMLSIFTFFFLLFSSAYKEIFPPLRALYTVI